VVSVSADWSEVPVLRWPSTLGCAICTVVSPFVDESGCLECSRPPWSGSSADEVAAGRAAVAQQHGARLKGEAFWSTAADFGPAPVRRRCFDRSGRDATPCLLITLVGGPLPEDGCPVRNPVTRRGGAAAGIPVSECLVRAFSIGGRMYVDSLIGPDTVTPLPEATIAVFEDQGRLARTIDVNVAEAADTMRRLGGRRRHGRRRPRARTREGCGERSQSFREELPTLDTKPGRSPDPESDDPDPERDATGVEGAPALGPDSTMFRVRSWP